MISALLGASIFAAGEEKQILRFALQKVGA